MNNTNQMAFKFDAAPSADQTCERCGQDEARFLHESNNVGTAVCSGCLAEEAWYEKLKNRGWAARGPVEAWRYYERGE